jgi:hypothetical protein
MEGDNHGIMALRPRTEMHGGTKSAARTVSRRWIECCPVGLPPLPIALKELVGFKTPANNIYCVLEEDWLRRDAKQIVGPVSAQPPDGYLDWGIHLSSRRTVREGTSSATAIRSRMIRFRHCLTGAGAVHVGASRSEVHERSVHSFNLPRLNRTVFWGALHYPKPTEL